MPNDTSIKWDIDILGRTYCALTWVHNGHHYYTSRVLEDPDTQPRRLTLERALMRIRQSWLRKKTKVEDRRPTGRQTRAPSARQQPRATPSGQGTS